MQGRTASRSGLLERNQYIRTPRQELKPSQINYHVDYMKGENADKKNNEQSSGINLAQLLDVASKITGNNPAGTQMGSLPSGNPILNTGEGLALNNQSIGLLSSGQNSDTSMPSLASMNNRQPNDIDRLVKAIGQFESSNKYDAVGVPTKSGDRAYGKYQVMGNNIPSWSKEVLGKEITPQEFIAHKEYQDAIARAKLAQYYNKYGTFEDASSMWFSGRPARNNKSRDALGTSVPEYIANVNRFI